MSMVDFSEFVIQFEDIFQHVENGINEFGLYADHKQALAFFNKHSKLIQICTGIVDLHSNTSLHWIYTISYVAYTKAKSLYTSVS